jgi:hypothetical protein
VTHRPNPTDFDPFRGEITDCYCKTCRGIMLAATDVLDYGGHRHLAAAEALLVELRAGAHRRMTFAEHVAEAKRDKAVRLAALRAAGAPASEIAAVERGYVRIGAL